MKLEEAEKYAKQITGVISSLCEKVLVVGSIRRRRPEVNDIDIVAIPDYSDYRIPDPFHNTIQTMRLKPDETWAKNIPEVLMRGPLKLLGDEFGKELMRLNFRENKLSVDIYRARPETWESSLLFGLEARSTTSTFAQAQNAWV